MLQMALIKDSTVTVTDLDLTTVVPFDSTEPFTGLIPVRKALDVLKGESGPLTITTLDNYWVRLEMGDCEFKLAGQDAANFPQTPKPAEFTLMVDGQEFKTLIKRTSFAISGEESRYTLCAALLVATHSGGVKMVTTDGHRMSMAQTKAANGTINTLIAPSALDWITKHATDKVFIGASEGYVTLNTGEKTLYARAVRGQFPAYESVIGGAVDHPVHAVIPSAKALSKTLARVAKCSDERSGAVRFSFNGVLEMKAQSTEVGTAYAVSECLTTGLPEGDDNLTIGWNSTYIMQFLNIAGDVAITVNLKDSQSVATFQADNWIYALMPMRV